MLLPSHPKVAFLTLIMPHEFNVEIGAKDWKKHDKETVKVKKHNSKIQSR